MASHTRHKALVTGGSRGIGAAIARIFEERGIEVLAPSRAELDLLDSASLCHYLATPQTADIDILVNNAGINVLNSLEQIRPEDWQTMFRLNLTAPLELIQGLALRMKAKGWGRIANISSIFSLVTREKRGAYSAVKSGLNGLSRSCALEFAPSNVLVNVVCPGYVETDLTRQNNSPEDLARIAQSIPAKRLAQPAEIARVVAFLCSEENTYITGHTLTVDGGFTLQ